MINRVYLKECLSFKQVDLEFDSGLNIFTGASGAGKSIFMKAMLSFFGKTDVKSSLAELNLIDSKARNESYGIDIEDEIVIKSIKKDKIRFFLNNQTISKKNLNEFSSSLIKYLNLKDINDFQSNRLIDFLDNIAKNQNKEFLDIKNNFDKNYKEFLETKKRLLKIQEDESKLEDLKEYTRYEISKIEELNPKVDEYEELQDIKKNLSKKEKIQEALNNANGIFEFRNKVSTLLELLDENSSFFDESMNELENIFEKSNDSLFELEEVDIDQVLTRIEKLASLQKRFGSILKALEYKEEKKKELEEYENISFEKTQLEKKLKQLDFILVNLSKEISKVRQEVLVILEEKINFYLSFLYLSNAKITLKDKPMDKTGSDFISFELNAVNIDTISSGEYNRLRLALLASMNEFNIVENYILFLDEIDANLSGKESEAVAKVLKKLSKKYQIFAISHQIHLSSVATQHFLVEKNENISTIKILNNNQRIKELARMISGENLTNEAIKFAKDLLHNNK